MLSLLLLRSLAQLPKKAIYFFIYNLSIYIVVYSSFFYYIFALELSCVSTALAIAATAIYGKVAYKK